MSRRHGGIRGSRHRVRRMPSTALLTVVVVTGMAASGCSGSSPTTTTAEALGAAGGVSGSSAPRDSGGPSDAESGKDTPTGIRGGALTDDGLDGDEDTDALSNGLPQPSAGDSTTAGAPDGPNASDRPDPRLSGRPVPTRPPGDGAPGEDDGGSADGGASDFDGSLIAETALLDAESVGGVTGGTWTVLPAGEPAGSGGAGTRCALPGNPGATAVSTRTLTASRATSVVERLAVYPSAAAAIASLTPLVRALTACGFRTAPDPRLGDESAHLTTSSGTGLVRDAVPLRDVVPLRDAVLVASEGVTVVLLLTDGVTGSRPTAAGSWESLADLALGSSCSAAVDGCH